MSIPITIRCECGESHSTDLGEVVSCECGRRYETSKLDQARLMRVRVTQMRWRLYVTFGIVFLLAATVLAWAVFGLKGAALAGPAAALLWFRFVGRYLRKRVFRGAGELPTWKLEAE